MATKILSGTYLSGYTLSGAFSAISVTSSGDVVGVGAPAAAYNASPGGVGLSLPKAVTATNAGFIVGGRGGAGGTTDFNGGYGGAGAVGVSLAAGGTVINTDAVYGGAGGDGGGGGQAGGAGGAGGSGISFAAVGTLINSGIIDGGVGGNAGTGKTTGQLGIGGAGVWLKAGGSVRNTGQILAGANGTGAGSALTIGLVLDAGGVVVNGSSTDHTAQITGGFGIVDFGSGATITNFGQIDGNSSWSAQLGPGDRLIAEAGSYFGHAAYGGHGVLELANTSGTLSGLGSTLAVSGSITGTFTRFAGYELDAGGQWVLYGSDYLSSGQSLTDHAQLTVSSGAALAVGDGATLYAGGQIANLGLVELNSTAQATDLKVLSSGATLSGGGFLTLNGPLARIYGASPSAKLDVLTTISGQGFIGLGSLTLVNHINGVIVADGAQGLVVNTKGALLTNGGLLESASGSVLVLVDTVIQQDANFGTITAQTGGKVDLENVTIFGGGTVSTAGSGAVNVNQPGSELDGASSPITVDGLVQVLSGDDLILNGSITGTGKINTFAGGGKATLFVGAAGATLSGGLQLNLSDSAGNTIVGLAAGDTLRNSDHIDGAGQLGNGVMTLVNTASGVIIGNQNLALTINTGANTIQNAGLIENNGKGGTVISSAINNTGTLLAATAGTLTVAGGITGSGAAKINGGTLYLAKANAQNVSFTGTTGVLKLGDSQAYTGKVTGLSGSGTDWLDLADITLTGKSKATFSGTTASGTLTVTDGTHTAHITLEGNYTKATFTVAGDGHGGVIVKDPQARAAATLTAAMAGFQHRPAGQLAEAPVWPAARLPWLARPV